MLNMIQKLSPDSVAAEHSQQLQNLIKAKIAAAGGQITFAEFMQLVLYAPGLGYYSAGQQKFGKHGDFITAPEISPLFSWAIAEQCAEILAATCIIDIFEFGAGSGIMAADILLHLEQLNYLPAHYYILEVSADLRERQQQTLQKKCPHLLEKIIWLTQLPQQKLTAIVLANEVLDAMPVEIFHTTATGVKQLFVTTAQDNLCLMPGEIINPQLKMIVEKLVAEFCLPLNYTSEVNLILQSWVQSVSDCLEQGVVLLIDYGYPRVEYYHPQRTQGTLQCFYQHRVHSDPLQNIGLQDITAHVDFTAVAEAAVAADFSVLGFTTQAMFLLNNKLLPLAEQQPLDAVDRFNQNQQIKLLTLPTEMGEQFKVIALGKNYSQNLQGFQAGNKLHVL